MIKEVKLKSGEILVNVPYYALDELDLDDKYRDELKKSALIENLQNEIKVIKHSYIDKGIKYKNITFYSTKDDTKDLISLGVATMQQGQAVKLWKGVDGYLDNPTLEELQELTKICLDNLQQAYQAEALCLEELQKITTVTELEKYNAESSFRAKFGK